MNSNIDMMAAAARGLGVRLRPHAKTHKVPEIARLGIGRTGVRVGVPACELAQLVTDLPSLKLIGVYGFRGFRGFAEGAESRDAWGRAEGEALASAAEDLRSMGLPIVEVSAGSTPTALPAAGVRGVTEIRPGQYLFGCANVVAQGVMRADEVALFARATVISRADDRVVVDAGSKTLSTDESWEPGLGFGYLASDPSTRVVSVWEEHGVLGLGESAGGLCVGDRVSIVPNHVCTAVNLHDRLVGVHDDRIEAVWKIAARGRIQ